MNYAGIIKVDLANGIGIRTSLFVSGCQFHCPHCFNFREQNYSYGEWYVEGVARRILQEIAKPYNSGLSILGGDPMWQNMDGMADLERLCNVVHDLGKTVWLWSGFTWEELTRLNTKADATQLMRYDLLAHVDVLVDGRYEAKLKDPTLAWRGSSNQRVIDVKASLHNDEIILYKEASNV
nr:MAG TPA: anaerobic ribonucleoside-triphosphate reductase activating protein [Bacteriophage sp.]